MLNFDNLDMTSTYQMEYEFGIITANDLYRYVGMGILSKEGYQEILGEPYAEQTEKQTQA